MPRQREYETDAQRQAAYRDRHRDQQQPREDYLAALARTLHVELEDAVACNQSVLPPELLGDKSDTTLRNLIRYIRLNTDRGKADPFLNPSSSQ